MEECGVVIVLCSSVHCPPRTKTVLLDRSLDKRGREKHILHFVSVMKVCKLMPHEWTW